MLTTSEAAEYLGISSARIRQLIASGQVVAERQGKSWRIERDSLDEYAASAKPGRPTRREAEVRRRTALRRFTLMSRDHQVARCSYDPLDMAFLNVRVLDAKRVPLALVGHQAKGALNHAFNSWWGSRSIPGSRERLSERLHELKLREPIQIPLASMGLSLSDQYWLREQGSSLSWDDVNYLRNEFDLGSMDLDGLAASAAGPWLNAVGLNSPDNTTDGMLCKRWLLDESGERVLIKGSGRSGREAYNEVVATMLYRRLLPQNRYVEYRLAQWRGEDVSVCRTFLSEEEEFIPAWYVYGYKKKPNHCSAYRHYCECCQALGVENAQGQLDRMLVCDAILANTDRHFGNFGIIRNVETLACRFAPIFDTGTSLWSHVPVREMAQGFFEFKTRPFHASFQRQLHLVLDEAWYHPEALEGFAEEVREFFESLHMRDLGDALAEGLKANIDAVNAWAQEAATKGLPEEVRQQSESFEWVWLS